MCRKVYKSTQIEELILGISIGITLALVKLPYEKIDGNPVPTIIFKDKPGLFHAFILALNFSFFGSVITISLRERYAKVARYPLTLAVVSMATAFGILTWLIVPMSSKLLTCHVC